MESREFLAEISHELRTPLNAIISFSEMLMSMEYSKNKQQQYLNNIAISGKHMLQLVDGILDLYKIELGKITLKYENVNSSNIINEIVNILTPMAADKSISIVLNLEKAYIDVDIKIFRQIMYNLINNSIKYTKKDGLICVNSSFEGGLFKVEVIDTGIGIPLKDYDKIFQRFTRISSGSSCNIEGSGLGLALTKALVEMLGGDIGFISKEDKGTKFWFDLPAKK